MKLMKASVHTSTLLIFCFLIFWTTSSPLTTETVCSPFSPKPVDSIENSLGFGISHQVKENIIKGEYVEMSSLLEKNQYENGEQTVSVVNGELVIQKINNLNCSS
jgi:hypothetical protein